MTTEILQALKLLSALLLIATIDSCSSSKFNATQSHNKLEIAIYDEGGRCHENGCGFIDFEANPELIGQGIVWE